MAREPHSTKPPRREGEDGVWFARIRSGAARPGAEPRREGVDAALEQRLRETADAAAKAAAMADRAARAASHAVGLADLMDAFGRRGGIDPDELAGAANAAMEAGAEAREQSAETERAAQLAGLAAQDEAAAAASEPRRDPGLGETWHR